MLKEFIEVIKNYKELVLLMITIISSIFIIRDYFATKEEVEILKCQADNGIAIIESRFNSEQLTRKIVSLKQDIDEALTVLNKRKILPVKKTTGIIALELEVEKLVRELSQEQDTQKMAAANLKPGVCEKAVRKK